MTDLSVAVGNPIEENTDKASVFWRFIQITDATNLWPPLTPGEIAAALEKLVTLGVLVVSGRGWQLVNRYEITCHSPLPTQSTGRRSPTAARLIDLNRSAHSAERQIELTFKRIGANLREICVISVPVLILADRLRKTKPSLRSLCPLR